MRKSQAARQYSAQSTTTLVQESRPEQLVFLMFEKAVSSLRRAVFIIESGKMEYKDAVEKVAATEDYYNSASKTLEIIAALKEMLDLEAGGTLAQNLEQTYSTILQSTWKAIKEKDGGSLDKICNALSELRDAWKIVSSGQNRLTNAE